MCRKICHYSKRLRPQPQVTCTLTNYWMHSIHPNINSHPILHKWVWANHCSQLISSTARRKYLNTSMLTVHSLGIRNSSGLQLLMGKDKKYCGCFCNMLHLPKCNRKQAETPMNINIYIKMHKQNAALKSIRSYESGVHFSHQGEP